MANTWLIYGYYMVNTWLLIWLIYGYYMVNTWLLIWLMMDNNNLVGGDLTILKNMSQSMGLGLSHI